MNWLEARVPPPIVLALFGAAALGVSKALPSLAFGLPARTPLALGFLVMGLALNLLPKVSFKRAETTTNPMRPEASTALVTSGIYRHSRNPMYLGHAAMLLGWAVHLSHAVAFLAVPAFVLYVSRFQIVPEERLLAARFPGAYAAFSREVPRWL